MTIKSGRVEQITLFLENRPGILADLCAHLADRDINIRAITTLESTETGAVRLVVDRTSAAAETLTQAGVAFTTGECLALEMPNTPGGFAKVARILAIAGINIDYMYASSPLASAVALGVLGVSDIDRALKLDWDQV
jgi:hypothetical protein